MPRSREDIAETISLGWLGNRESARLAVMQSIDWVVNFKLPDVQTIRQKAMRVGKALAILKREFPAAVLLGNEFTGIGGELCRVAGFHRAKGPDKRFNQLQWSCALQAYWLIKEFSSSPPVSTQDGNMHAIAQLLFEAATGRRCSKVGLLQTVKKVKRWREHMSP